MEHKSLEQIRKELDEVMDKIPEFKKSKRGKFLYSARDDIGQKVKVQYKGYNFIVSVGDVELTIKSISLRLVILNGVEPYLKSVLVRHTSGVVPLTQEA